MIQPVQWFKGGAVCKNLAVLFTSEGSSRRLRKLGWWQMVALSGSSRLEHPSLKLMALENQCSYIITPSAADCAVAVFLSLDG